MVRRAQSRARMPRFPTTSYNKKGGTGQCFYQCFTLHAMLTELRKNGTPPLFDILPFEINIENYFLMIGIICTLFGNFPRSSVG